MIATTPRMARALGRAARAARRGARGARRARTNNGTGAAGRASSKATTCRSRSRIAQLAEYVEVAHRVGGVEAVKDAGARAARQAVRPQRSPTCCSAEADVLLVGPRRVATWDAVIDAEPALAVVLIGRAVRRRAAGDRELRRPQVALHARPRAAPSPSWPRAAGGASGLAERRAHAAAGRPRAWLRPPRRLERDLGQARPARRRRVGARAPAPVPDRAHAPASPPRWRRSARSPCSTASASTARATRAGSPAARSPAPARILGAADAYQAMREPRPYRAGRSADEAAAELRAEVRAGRLDARRRRGGARRRRPPRPAPARGPGRPDRRARSRSSSCWRAGCRTRRSPRSS